MSKNSITLSPKHGVNPSMICCPVCGEPISIALMGKIKGDKEAPRKIIGTELCEKCIESCGDDKIYIMGIDKETGRLIGYVQVQRTIIKVDVPGYVAAMDADEFLKLFNKE